MMRKALMSIVGMVLVAVKPTVAATSDQPVVVCLFYDSQCGDCRAVCQQITDLCQRRQAWQLVEYDLSQPAHA